MPTLPLACRAMLLSALSASRTSSNGSTSSAASGPTAGHVEASAGAAWGESVLSFPAPAPPAESSLHGPLDHESSGAAECIVEAWSDWSSCSADRYLRSVFQ